MTRDLVKYAGFHEGGGSGTQEISCFYCHPCNGASYSGCPSNSSTLIAFKVLIDVPYSDLAEELAQSQPKIQVLQDTLQQVLDRREEERQSRQLLELYLKALKSEDSILSKVAGRKH